jgi:hypothetical protein
MKTIPQILSLRKRIYYGALTNCATCYGTRTPGKPTVFPFLPTRGTPVPRPLPVQVSSQRFASSFLLRDLTPLESLRSRRFVALSRRASLPMVLHGDPAPAFLVQAARAPRARASRSFLTLFVGCGTWTRTKILCSRGRCPTIRRSRKSAGLPRNAPQDTRNVALIQRGASGSTVCMPERARMRTPAAHARRRAAFRAPPLFSAPRR